MEICNIYNYECGACLGGECALVDGVDEECHYIHDQNIKILRQNVFEGIIERHSYLARKLAEVDL